MDSYFSRLESIFPTDVAEGDGSLNSTSSSSGDSASQTASQGPSHVGPLLRRRQTQDRSDDEREEPSDEVSHKRYKAYSRAACSREGLPPESIEWFAVLPRVYRDIEIFAKLTAHAARVLEGQNTMDQLLSPEFKKRFYQDLVGCMLSASITSYVKTALGDITELVRKNHDAFNIPTSTLENPEKWSQVLRLIGTLLSRVRGAIKAKIEQSLAGYVASSGAMRTKTEGIVELTRRVFTLAPHVEIESVHYARVAFLRMTYVEYKQLKSASGSTAPSLVSANNATTSAIRAPTSDIRAATPGVRASTPGFRGLTPASRATTPLPRPASLSRSVSASSLPFGPPESSAVQDVSDPGPEAEETEDLEITKRFWLYIDNTLEGICKEAQGPADAPHTKAQYHAYLEAFFSKCFDKDCKEFGGKAMPKHHNGPTTLQQVVTAYYA